MNTEKVIVNNARLAVGKDGREFTALDLVKPTMVKSKTSGRYYVGGIKASITTSLSLAVAKSLIGSEMDGNIVKQDLPVEQHRDWKNLSTGELVKITTQNVYIPNGK